MLPAWMQWIQAIALILIPVVGTILGSWIAYRQALIAAGRLNLDLYDKRFKVYEAARTLLGVVLRESTVTTKDILTFNVGVAEATFLFGSDVANYLTDLRRKATLLHTRCEQLSATRYEDKRRDKLIDQIAILEQELATEPDRLVEAFKPYLNLGNI